MGSAIGRIGGRIRPRLRHPASPHIGKRRLHRCASRSELCGAESGATSLGDSLLDLGRICPTPLDDFMGILYMRPTLSMYVNRADPPSTYPNGAQPPPHTQGVWAEERRSVVAGARQHGGLRAEVADAHDVAVHVCAMSEAARLSHAAVVWGVSAILSADCWSCDGQM